MMVLLAFLTIGVQVFAQNSVAGKVTDESGEPLVGASVLVKGTHTGTVTDLDGNYKLAGVSSNSVLVFSSIGYKTVEATVGNQKNIYVVLPEDTEYLDDVVVVGYGTARRADVTGSIASVDGGTLRAIPANDISRALDGRVAGVMMTQTDSKPGSSMQIRIRGQRSLSASNDPLIVLDGMPFMGSLSDISTNDIKSMDILKDAASTAIYGSRGANGVILITTYKGVEGQAPKVSFNSYGAYKKAVKYPMMPKDKYIRMREMAGQYKNSVDESNDVFTDWQDLFYRPGYTQNYALNIAGGTKEATVSALPIIMMRLSSLHRASTVSPSTEALTRRSASGSR